MIKNNNPRKSNVIDYTQTAKRFNRKAVTKSQQKSGVRPPQSQEETLSLDKLLNKIKNQQNPPPAQPTGKTVDPLAAMAALRINPKTAQDLQKKKRKEPKYFSGKDPHPPSNLTVLSPGGRPIKKLTPQQWKKQGKSKLTKADVDKIKADKDAAEKGVDKYMSWNTAELPPLPTGVASEPEQPKEPEVRRVPAYQQGLGSAPPSKITKPTVPPKEERDWTLSKIGDDLDMLKKMGNEVDRVKVDPKTGEKIKYKDYLSLTPQQKKFIKNFDLEKGVFHDSRFWVDPETGERKSYPVEIPLDAQTLYDQVYTKYMRKNPHASRQVADLVASMEVRKLRNKMNSLSRLARVFRDRKKPNVRPAKYQAAPPPKTKQDQPERPAPSPEEIAAAQQRLANMDKEFGDVGVRKTILDQPSTLQFAVDHLKKNPNDIKNMKNDLIDNYGLSIEEVDKFLKQVQHIIKVQKTQTPKEVVEAIRKVVREWMGGFTGTPNLNMYCSKCDMPANACKCQEKDDKKQNEKAVLPKGVKIMKVDSRVKPGIKE